MESTMQMPEKIIHKIAPEPGYLEELRQNENRQLRTAAYCRVSTLAEEQHLSYETQIEAYTEKIMKNPKWRLVEIFADEGLSGTSTKRRKDFLRMIKWCEQGKIDLIITKSISRFARNTVDSLNYIRVLKQMGVAVIFEKEGFNTLEVTNEFILTIYSSLAQAESESHSGNVKWGHRKRFAQGTVYFPYKSVLGFKKGEDGKPEIVPEEAEIVREIYDLYLSGESEKVIANSLTNDGFLTPRGKKSWSSSTVRSILTNEKYMGDAVIQKTFTVDCMSKKIEKNRGQLPKYHVENNHPAIIDKEIWNRVQEEISRRSGKRKVKEVGSITEQGKYSSKFALTELLVCGECGTPYRRVTWNIRGKKKIVWRCISRLDYGKRFCKGSPSIEEELLKNAILKTIGDLVCNKSNVIELLAAKISEMLTQKKPVDGVFCDTDNKKLDPVSIRLRISKIDEEVNKLIELDAKEKTEGLFDERFKAFYNEKTELLKILNVNGNSTGPDIASDRPKRELELFQRLEELGRAPCIYDEKIIRQMIECVRVVSKEQVHITFRLGFETDVFL